LIEISIENTDFTELEGLTHGLKGSTTNLGTGGISDLLITFNTYLTDGTDTDIIQAYHRHFIHYLNELKKQYT